MLPETITIDNVTVNYTKEENGKFITVGYSNGFDYVVSSTSNCIERAKISLLNILKSRGII